MPCRALGVYLKGLRVGALRLGDDGAAEFTMESSYIDAYPRPVLSQSFLDDLHGAYVGRMGNLPSFFSNLLPDREGRLREIIAAQLGLKPHQEFHLLARLGEDLPGAVYVEPEEGSVGEEDRDGEAPPGEANAIPRFSLAGIQLKFSMLARGGGLTYPQGGRGGDFIVKLPYSDEPAVPENEFSVMTWARACGLDVPEFSLVPVDRLEGLPAGVVPTQGNAFVIRRFDRAGDDRVHIEDMAQAFGVAPNEKYEQKHYEHIGALLGAVADEKSTDEYVGRLVFMVVCGNSDAHLKNWSLIYPDGVAARLSPMYDYVSTVVYRKYTPDEMALRLGRSRKYRDVTLELFRNWAEKARLSPDRVERIVRATAERARDEWLRIRGDLPMLTEHKDEIERHWARVPIVKPLSS